MPTRFAPDDIRRLAALARIEMHDHELAEFSTQLGRILDYAEVVAGVDTTDVLPLAQAGDAGAHDPRWRDDVVRPSLDRDAALAAAPDADREAGLFRVPKVL